jgi:lysyl-tRNA synthetase class 2
MEERKEKLKKIRELGGHPYKMSKFKKEDIENIINKYEDLKNSEEVEDVAAAAGRVMALRSHGKTTFVDIKDETGKIQLYINKKTLGEKHFSLFENVDIGDIIGVKGPIFKTKMGELSIGVKKLTVLAKSFNPLPEKWHGLKDIEIRYRQRYLDLIINPKTKEIFNLRGRIISSIRNFLNNKNFIEVETPMMQPIPGGAAALPFITHHHALDIDLYLRIAPELYLKRLIVGGFEKIYEINRNFRNEGISTRHNPEFTMLELYQAYADYKDIMTLVERLLNEVIKEVLGKNSFVYQDKKIEIPSPWPRESYTELINKHTGIELKNAGDKDLRDYGKKFGKDIKNQENRTHLIDYIFKKAVVPNLTGPLFVIDHPTELCPLAKVKPEDPFLSQRFQPYIAGIELGNAYSELNDPVEQEERFKEQSKHLEEGDEEAHRFDSDFIEALKYGLPPTGGLGIGIDRLVMLLTDSPSIRDVILFPQLKPEKAEDR